jgi:hypothetical protein
MGQRREMGYTDWEQYTNPPLHPTNPRWNKRAVASLLAVKAVMKRESTTAFHRHQSKRAAREATEKQEKEKLRTHGFMINNGKSEQSIERTPANRHFFVHNKQANRFELIQQGSALIVNLLRLHEPSQTASSADNHLLALFDIDGNFYNQLSLSQIESVEAEPHSPVKHTATFQPSETDQPALTIRIDDIYCLSLASPHK